MNGKSTQSCFVPFLYGDIVWGDYHETLWELICFTEIEHSKNRCQQRTWYTAKYPQDTCPWHADGPCTIYSSVITIWHRQQCVTILMNQTQIISADHKWLIPLFSLHSRANNTNNPMMFMASVVCYKEFNCWDAGKNYHQFCVFFKFQAGVALCKPGLIFRKWCPS